ncbi:hypothetical protein ACIPLA_28205, partial [Pseudomonas sp. NPDC086112]|uniref:hypothetical protein n=1 Tax=Pseudomonas sp. NPDC086112 TaxID=3364430 RepID=UPI00380017EC
MRICALRILLTATFSMALVIFCVLLMLAILLRISFAPPCNTYQVSKREPCGSRCGLPGLGGLELLDTGFH